MKRRFKKQRMSNRLFLSQRELADFLGVSVSLVTMYETGRRSLPKGLSEKLTNLEIDFEKSKAAKTRVDASKQLQNKLVEQDQAAVSKMLVKISTNRPYVEILQPKFLALSEKIQAKSAWYNFVGQKLQDLVVDKSTTRERLWLNMQQADVLAWLIKANKQLNKLTLKIDMLLAEAAVYERHAARLKRTG